MASRHICSHVQMATLDGTSVILLFLSAGGKAAGKGRKEEGRGQGLFFPLSLHFYLLHKEVQF